jgi:protein-serine/threonine kinase
MSPYFRHQGLPSHHHQQHGLPHHTYPTNGTSTNPSSNEGFDSIGGTSLELDDSVMNLNPPSNALSKPSSPKSALKRQLRRVASAPNAHGLLNGLTTLKGSSTTTIIDTKKIPDVPMVTLAPPVRPPTADMITTESKPTGYLLPVPQTKDQIFQKPGSFRRTYSSNSIKVRNVQVGPQSFEKIKLLGKGDVGKVYLVKEKKSQRLYAMKGSLLFFFFMTREK